MKGIYKTINDLTKEISFNKCKVYFTAKFSNKIQRHTITKDEDNKILKFNRKYILMKKDSIDDLKTLIENALLDIECKNDIARFKYTCSCGEELIMFRRPRINHYCLKCNNVILKGDINETTN